MASRALADARQRLDVLERAHAEFFLRLESWQRLLGRDPDRIDLAEFISDLRGEIVRLSEEQVRAHRRETRLRLALVEAGARVPTEEVLVEALPEEVEHAGHPRPATEPPTPQVSLRDAVLARRHRHNAPAEVEAPTATPGALSMRDALEAATTPDHGEAALLAEVTGAAPDRAQTAARTLAERLGAAAAPAILVRLNAALDAEERAAWLAVLARTGGPVAEQAALRWSADEAWSVRAAAADALAALTEGEAQRAALERALTDPDARVRRRGALAAAQWLGKKAEPLVAPLLDDPSPGTRRLATTILRGASARRPGRALVSATTAKRSTPWST
ncbi:MAG: hypothetical protein H6730_08225 [Deltaproteobacteria bacterium]|nr:hypothetical protein [Deltaproteobacteria bacterium]